MRIALRALTPPFLRKAASSSPAMEAYIYGGHSMRTDVDDGARLSNAPAMRYVPDDGARTGTGSNDHGWQIDVPGVAEGIPLLRRWVRLLLADDVELAEAFELIVSEYGTNALWHTASSRPGGRIRAELRIGTHQTRLVVRDDGPSPVRSDRSADPAEHGRGLLLADAYADETGQYDCADGHATWALIHR